jgi:hypothetical protein
LPPNAVVMNSVIFMTCAVMSIDAKHVGNDGSAVTR